MKPPQIKDTPFTLRLQLVMLLLGGPGFKIISLESNKSRVK